MAIVGRGVTAASAAAIEGVAVRQRNICQDRVGPAAGRRHPGSPACSRAGRRRWESCCSVWIVSRTYRPGPEAMSSSRTGRPAAWVCSMSRSQRLFQQRSPDANAAPADGVEIEAIDETTQRRQALRPVLVDVIEHDAGVEAVLPAEVDAAAQPARSLHQPAHGGEPQTARPAQAVVLVAREAAPVGIEERRWRRRFREAFADEVAHLLDNEPPVLLVEDRMGESGQHLEPLDRRGDALDELPLGRRHAPPSPSRRRARAAAR